MAKERADATIADRYGFIARIGPEVNIVRNELGQLNALIARLEASEDVREVWDTIMCLRGFILRSVKRGGEAGDLQRGHWYIGLKILAWKKVGSEARDKLWDEITVKSAAGTERDVMQGVEGGCYITEAIFDLHEANKQ
ncbi:hypothetical protein Tco_1548650 [Tanacetum coccineum]